MRRAIRRTLSLALVFVIIITATVPAPTLAQSEGAPASGEPGVVWATTLNQTHIDVPRALIPSHDGGYLLLAEGHRKTTALIAFTADGREQWRRTYEHGRDRADPNNPWDYDIDTATDIIPTRDGGYLLVGETGAWMSDSNGWVLKLNSQGDISWSQEVNHSTTERFTSVVETDDGEFIAVGTHAYGVRATGWVVVFDADGTVQSQRVYGDGYNAEFNDILALEDNTYLLVGAYRPPPTDQSWSPADGWVLAIDESGTELWNQTYRRPSDQTFQTITQFNDDYLLVGTTQVKNENATGTLTDSWVVQIAADGTLQRQAVHGLGVSVHDAVDSGDGHVLLVGQELIRPEPTPSSEASASESDAPTTEAAPAWPNWEGSLVIRDSTGTETMNRTFGSATYEQISVAVVNDEGITFAGTTGFFGNQDLWIVHLRPGGAVYQNELFARVFPSLSVTAMLAAVGLLWAIERRSRQ